MIKFHLGAGVDISATDRYGGTPLHTAAFYGNQALVQFLLDAGAEIEAPINLA